MTRPKGAKNLPKTREELEAMLKDAIKREGGNIRDIENALATIRSVTQNNPPAVEVTHNPLVPSPLVVNIDVPADNENAPTYHCQNCQGAIFKGQLSCMNCGTQLDWTGV